MKVSHWGRVTPYASKSAPAVTANLTVISVAIHREFRLFAPPQQLPVAHHFLPSSCEKSAVFPARRLGASQSLCGPWPVTHLRFQLARHPARLPGA
jgi:hypothetical protein